MAALYYSSQLSRPSGKRCQGGDCHRCRAQSGSFEAPLLQVCPPSRTFCVSSVSNAASRYNAKWSRSIQHAIGTTVYCGWLGGFGSDAQPGQLGRLLTLEEVGAIFSGNSSSFPTYALRASN